MEMSGCFTPKRTHWKVGWMDPRVTLSVLEIKKISCPCWGLNLVSVFPKTFNEKPHKIYIFVCSVQTDFSVRKYLLHTLWSSHGNCTQKIILRHSVQLELLSNVLETVSASIIRFRYDEQDSCLLYLHTQVHTEIIPPQKKEHAHTRWIIASTEGYARMNVIDFRTSFVIAAVRSSKHWTICIRGNMFQAQSLEQSYHPTKPFTQEKYNTNKKYKCKNNVKFIYLTFIHSTNKTITELNW